MKLTHYIYISTALAALAACSDDVTPDHFVDDAHNTIVLHAGVTKGGSGVTTRAVDGNHGKHVLFETGNKLALRIDGTWTGKGPIIQYTTAKTGDQASSVETEKGYTHNSLEMDPLRFWNDYGVADPTNTDGRAAGLTIYGVAVNKAGVNAPSLAVDPARSVDEWESGFTWSLGTPDANNLIAYPTGGWGSKDLLTSNNISVSVTGDGTYTFDDYLAKLANPSASASDILEFTHAMSKVTVVLTAGVGFKNSEFVGNPTVTLKNFAYTGTVKVKEKTSTPTSDKADIQMHLTDGGAAANTATLEALVYPGNVFNKVDEKDVDILELTADGNTFVVTAANLNAAIDKAITDNTTTGYPGTDHSLQQGWNYKLRITVNKTEINVEATIVDWDELIAAEESPKIRITDSYGQTGAAFAHDFDFFRSLTIDAGYSNDAWVDHTEADGKHTYQLMDQLYWPDHNTHYFFRGVYPRVGSESGFIPAANVTEATNNASLITVQNAAYALNTYPSDLAIGYPRTTAEACKAHSKTVATAGICATEGTIRMNFEYVMSQVEVKLTSAEGNGHVNLDENTVIKIVGGYTAGNIKLKDGSVELTGTTGDWLMLGKKTPDSSSSVLVDYLDAVVPQTLGDMKFVITVKNADDNYDIYECKIADIAVGGSTIEAWESGKKYVYTLEIQKTAIKVAATLKDWVTVEANGTVWF